MENAFQSALFQAWSRRCRFKEPDHLDALVETLSIRLAGPLGRNPKSPQLS